MTAAALGGPCTSIAPLPDTDSNLTLFLVKLASVWTLAKKFLDTIQGMPEGRQKKRAIQDWLKKHQDDLAKFTSLNLAHSHMTIIPDEIAAFINLRELNLSYNDQINFNAIEKLNNLRILQLQENHYTQLPAFLERCCLKKLNLKGNKLGALPKFVNRLEQADLKGNPCGLVDHTKKRWDGSREGVRQECFRLCWFTPLVHSVGVVVNMAYRVVRIVSLANFSILPEGKTSPFKARLQEASFDLVRICAAPFLLIALQSVAFYGYCCNPFQGVIIYARIENFVYGGELIGRQWVNNLALGSYMTAYKVLIIYCALKM